MSLSTPENKTEKAVATVPVVEKSFTIDASLRATGGKTYARKLRRNGMIPAVLNSKGKSTLLEMDPKILPKVWREGGRKFSLKVGGETTRVLISELQLDPVKRVALHVDLSPCD